MQPRIIRGEENTTSQKEFKIDQLTKSLINLLRALFLFIRIFSYCFYCFYNDCFPAKYLEKSVLLWVSPRTGQEQLLTAAKTK